MNDNFFSQSANRLKSERVRLGFNQAEAGDLCGVSREMWGKYERALAVPGGEVLFSFAAAGADVQYILTGIRAAVSVAESLNSREAALLDNYRHVEDEVDKKSIERMALLAAKADVDEKTTKKVVNAR